MSINNRAGVSSGYASSPSLHLSSFVSLCFFVLVFFCCSGGSSTGDAEDLSYAEWIQLLGLLAYSLGDARLLGQRNDLTSSFGVPEKDGGELNGSNVSTLPMLTRLQLLFFNMSALGAKFEGQECQKMIRSITATIRKEAAEARREAMRVSAQERTIGSSRQVQQVLQQSFVL